jgi:hypothetical protein
LHQRQVQYLLGVATIMDLALISNVVKQTPHILLVLHDEDRIPHSASVPTANWAGIPPTPVIHIRGYRTMRCSL